MSNEHIRRRPGPWRSLASHRSWLSGQALALLDFFRGSLDASGHFVDLDDEGRPWLSGSAGAGGQSLLNVARAVHCYALGELLGVPGCGPIVDRGLELIWHEHRDMARGGYVETAAPGGPVDSTKAAYGHAFVLLAASSASQAGHDARGVLDDVLEVLDERFWSDHEGASRGSFSGEWTELEAYRGANANMHLCEAYLAAGDATGDQALSMRAYRIARLVIDRHARASKWLLPEHYDEAWQPLPEFNSDRLDDRFRPYGVTIGHMIEWSRLLQSCAVALGEPEGWLDEAASGLFWRAVELGWDKEHGGLCYTIGWDGAPANRDHYWWPITEGISASAYLAQRTGDARYDEWYQRFWDFAGRYLVDHARGGWYAVLDEHNRRKDGPWPGKPDLYHALQCCILPLVEPAPSLAGALCSAHATSNEVR